MPASQKTHTPEQPPFPSVATKLAGGQKPLEVRKINVAVVTVSDRAYQGIYKDESGPKVAAAFPADLYHVAIEKIVPDEINAIASELIRCTDIERMDVVVTTGGTGCSPRDITPEATEKVLHKQVVGFSDAIRLVNREKNPNAILSRGLSGLRHRTLIVNLPGSPDSAKMAVETILPAIPHCIKTMRQQRTAGFSGKGSDKGKLSAGKS